MQIAFWSPNHGQTGTTTTAMTMAIMTALTTGFHVLLCHCQLHRSTMERCLLPKANHHSDDRLDFNDNGMDALRRLARNGRLQPEMIRDYTTPLLSKGRLDILQGATDKCLVTDTSELERQRKIFQHAGEVYDLVFVDVPSGIDQPMSNKLIKDAELVVICLNQNTWLIEDFLENKGIGSLLEGKKVLYHFGAFDQGSRYTSKNLSRRYGLNKVITTPYICDLRDAANHGTLLNFLLRHYSKGQGSRHSHWVKALDNNVGKLIKEASLREVELQ